MLISDAPAPDPSCAFCANERLFPLYEGRDFYVLADHAPLAEGHLLLIPRAHYPHLAALPAALDEEFAILKAWLGDFVRRSYGSLTYWENGIFGQSVPHAHLHALSLHWDPTVYRDAGPAFRGLAGLRAAYEAQPGPYFALEQEGEGHLLPPDWQVYRRVLLYARETFGGQWLVTREERRLQGAPLVAALLQKWQDGMAGLSPSPGAEERVVSSTPGLRHFAAREDAELQAP